MGNCQNTFEENQNQITTGVGVYNFKKDVGLYN